MVDTFKMFELQKTDTGFALISIIFTLALKASITEITLDIKA